MLNLSPAFAEPRFHWTGITSRTGERGSRWQMHASHRAPQRTVTCRSAAGGRGAPSGSDDVNINDTGNFNNAGNTVTSSARSCP